MNEDIIDLYNKKVFLESLKTGKVPKRAGLGSRLYLLAGFDKEVVSCHVERNALAPFDGIVDLRHLTNRLCYAKNHWNAKREQVVENLNSYKMREVFRKYLGEYYITNSWCYMFVHFDPKIEVNWGVLDQDLKIMYPKNHKIDKRGFVYHKS